MRIDMKDQSKASDGISRRQFLQTTTLAGAAMLSTGAASVALAGVPAPVRTVADQVTLGKTGLKLSRLGFGLGSNNGKEQAALGKDGFNKLIHYAYDQGITCFDTAQSYMTFKMIGEAIKGLPREKLFIQSKVEGNPADILGTIDQHRKTFDTDYVDSLLLHSMTNGKWADNLKRAMDGLSAAQEKKWIRAKGISSHCLPALRTCVSSDWPEVLLARVNPQGIHTDVEDGNVWNSVGHDIAPVMEQVKAAHAKGAGVIGIKIYGNGEFKKPEDREKSIRFAMACKDIDAVVIGFSSQAQIDEAIERINRALKEV
jgi:predicted aldo/keto reductase-like oxidoreductase